MVPCSYTVPCARAGRYHPTEPVVIDVGAALHGNVMFKISSLSLGDPDTGAAAQRNRLRQSRLHVATGRTSCGAPHRAALRRHHQLFVRGDFAADQPAGCTGGTGLPTRARVCRVPPPHSAKRASQYR